jgi:hypothetical protein
MGGGSGLAKRRRRWLREERAGSLSGSSFVPAIEREKRLGVGSEEGGRSALAGL